jgi:hypothetical protein
MVLQVVGDESGSDGENLSRPTHQIFSYGTTSLTLADATSLVVETREAIGSTGDEARSSAELKSSKLFKKHRPIAEALFEVGGPLEGKASIYLADKVKFLAGKMVSLLIEEYQYALQRPLGIELESAVANELVDWVLPTLATPIRERLLDSFNKLCRSYKTDYAPANRATDFIDALRLAIVSASSNRRASQMLDWLWRARSEVYEVERDTSQTRDLEPMLPTLLVVATTWNDLLGGEEFEIHMDEYQQMTPLMLDIVKLNARHLWNVDLRDIIQVTSKDDPRVQVADWIAGAGRIAAGELLAGRSSRLGELVLPFVDENSMRSPGSALERWLAGS